MVCGRFPPYGFEIVLTFEFDLNPRVRLRPLRVALALLDYNAKVIPYIYDASKT